MPNLHPTGRAVNSELKDTTMTEGIRTRLNNWTVNNGKDAASADRQKVFAAKAEALYTMYVSAR